MLKTTFNLEIRYLEIKKQDAKYDRFFSSLKCKKQLFIVIIIIIIIIIIIEFFKVDEKKMTSSKVITII